MLYYKCEYGGLFNGGTAYFQAQTLKGVHRQIGRVSMHFDLKTLRRISKRTFIQARANRTG